MWKRGKNLAKHSNGYFSFLKGNLLFRLIFLILRLEKLFYKYLLMWLSLKTGFIPIRFVVVF